MQQEEALCLLKMEKNVFLTGAAGAGKTYVLNKYIQYLREHDVSVAITASTGIAATHLEGMTIHAWSGIGVRDALTEMDLDKIKTNKRIIRNYKNTKVLVIDEISMLHPHQLDMVDEIARVILENQRPFGGIQIVLCGDFFQLPPISTASRDKEIKFAFESRSWQEANMYTCYLHEQHRQGDDCLLTVLNDIRSGTAGEHTKVPLRTRYKKEPCGDVKPTRLYTHNVNVDAINQAELTKLKGVEKSYYMTTKGFSKTVEGLKRSCLALENLKLKVGAEVLFIKNDNAFRYVNGTRGVVVGFDKSAESWPVVKTFNNNIIVASPEEWKYEDNGVVRATISQVPLRLAWAITIHKSQGMTLDAAEIDLGDAFQPGMGYVALSRVRRLDGIKLMNLNEMALKVDLKVLAHDKVFQEHSVVAADYLKTLSEEEINICQRKKVVERAVGKKKKAKKEKVPTHLVTLKMLKFGLSIEEIATERGVVTGTVVGHLEKAHTFGLLDEVSLSNIKATIPEDDFKAIHAEFIKSEDGALLPIFNKFEGKQSYNRLKLVRLLVSI